jgi:hypothetical protein
MRFDRQPRHAVRTMSERMREAYARKLQKETARYPLFPDHVAAEQRSLDTEAARRAAVSLDSECERRQFLAQVWRNARALYFAQPVAIRLTIASKWRAWTGPCTATYFAWMVDVESGQQAARLKRIVELHAPVAERIRRQVAAEAAAVLTF